MDPPEHTKFRRILARDFMVRKIEALRPQVEAIVNALLDQILRFMDDSALYGVDALPATWLPEPSDSKSGQE